MVRPAEVFADVDDQSVKFVEELRIPGQRSLQHRANFFVAGSMMRKRMPLEDAAGVGVHNEDRLFAGVKKDGVGGLRANTADGEDLLAKDFSRSSEHSRKGAAVRFVEKLNERLEGFGLLAEVTRRAEQRGQPVCANSADALG